MSDKPSELDEVIQFIIEALRANAAKGRESILTIHVAPYAKSGKAKEIESHPITSDDVLDTHELLKKFDGDFKKLFNSRK